MATPVDMPSETSEVPCTMVPAGAAAHSWQVSDCDPAMQETMAMLYASQMQGMLLSSSYGYSSPHDATWPALVQGSFLQPGMNVPTTGQGVEANQYFQPGWPADFSQAGDNMPSSWAVDPTSQTISTGVNQSLQQRQKKCRKPKGASFHGNSQRQLKDGDECSADQDAQEQDPEENETVQARIKMMADGILRELKSGSKPREQLAIAHFATMIFEDTISSRAAQAALEAASGTEQMSLITGLHGQVRSAMNNKHANYAITKAVEVMPAGRIGFISEELQGHGCEIARHRFGCRILCRILEHFTVNDVKSIELLDEVLRDAGSLCNHSFGSIVMRHFLEHGLPEHRHRVAKALLKDLTNSALQRKGSYVVEAALRFCSQEDKLLLAKQLIGNSEALFDLASGQFGRHVVLVLLNLENDVAGIRQMAIEALMPLAQRLSTSKVAKHVYSELLLSASAQVGTQSPSRL